MMVSLTNLVVVVKSKDLSIAKEYGISEPPALIYFEKQIPSIYQSDISAEEDVLQWLIQQKTEDTIESVNRELLEQLISNTQYLVVYFCEYAKHFQDFCVLTESYTQTSKTARPATLCWRSWRTLTMTAKSMASTLSRS